MLEGIFGFVMTSLFCIHQDPFEQMKIINKTTPKKIKGLIIFLLVLLYRVVEEIFTESQ